MSIPRDLARCIEFLTHEVRHAGTGAPVRNAAAWMRVLRSRVTPSSEIDRSIEDVLSACAELNAVCSAGDWRVHAACAAALQELEILTARLGCATSAVARAARR